MSTPIWRPGEIRDFGGTPHVLEYAIHVDYALLRGYRADRHGNVQFRGGSQNFNPSFARAARVAIVEVDEIVEPGAIPPELIDLPGILRGARREDHARGRRQGPGSSRTAPT